MRLEEPNKTIINKKAETNQNMPTHTHITAGRLWQLVFILDVNTLGFKAMANS